MGFKRLRREHNYSLRRAKVFSKLSSVVLIGVLACILLGFAVLVYFMTQIPSPEQLSARNESQATRIYDRNGQLLYDVFQNENRTSIPLSQMPDFLKDATISIEDKSFYEHGGFSVTGIARSALELVLHRQIEGGGSTITQQLVKNTLLTPEQSWVRKIKEVILAIQVERVYSKDQILEMYLNTIPYGGTSYGIESAANLYFGIHAKDLDLAQSALLAGLPQMPSVYSPYGTNPELSKVRQKEVLSAMVSNGYITQKQADDAYNEKLAYRTSQKELGMKAPYFVMYVKQKLIEQYGEAAVEQGGLKVYTSLDYNIQQQAENIVKSEIGKLGAYHVGNGAAVVMDPKTGEILAMVGGKDYFGDPEPAGCTPGVNCTFEPNVNTSIALRQPGSATKPITYSEALVKGYTAATVLMDVQTDFSGGADGQASYSPVNYDGQWHGPTQVRYALGNSINIPAVKTLAMVGIKNDMDLAYKMGLANWEPTDANVANVGLSLTLGGRETNLLDLTDAYSALADQGIHQDTTSILKVMDSKDKTLYEYQPSDGRKVLDSGIAFIISNILSDNGARTMEFGSNSVLNVPGKTVSVKTGTTDDKRDNWTVGYTPSYVVGVWVGNNDNEMMNPVISSGITGASPIWQKIIMAVLANKPDEKPAQPDDVVYTDVDGLMGGLPHPGSPTRKEYFIKGTEPTAVSPAYQNLKVCKNNPHRLANDNEDGDNKDVIVLKENDPTGANTWQTGIDKWVLTAPNPEFVGVTKGCSGIPGFAGGATGGIINIANISNGANVPRVFDVLATTNSPFGVKKVTWSIDGAIKSTLTQQPFALHVEFPQGDKGSHTITATLEDNNGGTFSTSIGVTVSL